MKAPGLMKIFFLFFFIATAAACNEEGGMSEEPGEVLYAIVTEKRLTLTSNLPGRISALVVSEVRPQVDGIIIDRLFEEGADVKKGQILYQIDPAVYQAAYNTAKAVLAEANANVSALALMEKRYRALMKTESISRQELDNAISSHGQALARVAKAKAELEAAAINLAYTEIKAPVSGRIGASSVTPGALVTANQSGALAVIQQTGRVYVDMTQPSSDTIRLRRSMAQGKMSSNGSAGKVRITLEDGTLYTPVTNSDGNSPPQVILGELLFSEITVGQTTGSVSLRAVVDNPDGLLMPGMYVTATIEEGALDNAVLIPQSSVLSSPSGGHFVFLLQKDKAGEGLYRVEQNNIELLRTYGNRWIVKSGLSAGDLLVVEGLQKAVPGELVRGVPLENSSEPAAQPASVQEKS